MILARKVLKIISIFGLINIFQSNIYSMDMESEEDDISTIRNPKAIFKNLNHSYSIDRIQDLTIRALQFNSDENLSTSIELYDDVHLSDSDKKTLSRSPSSPYLIFNQKIEEELLMEQINTYNKRSFLEYPELIFKKVKIEGKQKKM